MHEQMPGTYRKGMVGAVIAVRTDSTGRVRKLGWSSRLCTDKDSQPPRIVAEAQYQRLIPGPQIHDSWALPQWGRVRFNTANRGGSSCRLRYHYARILMRRSCGVW